MSFDEKEKADKELILKYMENAMSEMQEWKSQREKFTGETQKQLIHFDFYLPVITAIKVLEVLKDE